MPRSREEIEEEARRASDLLKTRFVPFTGIAAIDEMLLKCVETLKVKNADYTEGKAAADPTAHFKKAAEDSGITVEQAWNVLFGKQLSAIKRYVKEGRVESEPIESRIMDAINYLLLLACIVDEKRPKEPMRELLQERRIYYGEKK